MRLVMHDLLEEPTLTTGKDSNALRHRAERVFLFVSVLVVLFAASLRIYHIAQRSLWLDEAVAANISRGTLAQTLVLTRCEHSAPIAHPVVLYAVEKVAAGPLAVRSPSLVASVLAVFLMLYFVTIPSIDHKTAALSALMLSVSAVQIRFAQEVREYSLSVLYAALLLYFFMSYVSHREEHNSQAPLYLTLFFAPLIQYGLVLFSFGILAALLILRFTDSKLQVRIAQIMKASVFLVAGGLLSFVLTLRYQWGETPWYLQENYFTLGTGFLHFVRSNTQQLLTFLLPGVAAALVSAVAILFHLVTSIRARIVSPLAVLAITSFGIVLVCAVLHRYPYGGTRQCLFLAPLLCLLGSASLVQVANRFRGVVSRTVFVAIACIVVVSGIFQICSMKPYSEVEDVQRILLGLQNRFEPGDGVYIYSGAVPAVDFYVKKRDQRFTYGDFHREAPEEYVSEILVGLLPETNRVWLLFSHIYDKEDRRILHDLSSDWEVEQILSADGSALYLARARSAFVHKMPANHDMKYGDTIAAERIPMTGRASDSFWDWNIRNSCRAAR